MACVVNNRLTISGFVVGDLWPKYIEEFSKEVPEMLARGEIKYKEHVVHGLAQAGQLIYDVQKGNNLGKAVIILAEH